MDYFALDVETANADYSSICQIGVAGFEGGRVVSKWSSLVNPRTFFDPFNTSIHGISAEDVEGAPGFESAHQELSRLLKSSIVVHHGHFDRTAFRRSYEHYSVEPMDCSWLDTTSVVRRTFKEFSHSGYNLKNLSRHFGIELDHHDALSDALATGEVLGICLEESGTSLADWLLRVRRPITSASDYTGAGRHDGYFAGCSIVFTGSLSVPRREASEVAKTMGFDVKNSVTKSTTHLCVGIQDSEKLVGYNKSSKHRKAEDLINKGAILEILSEEDFWALQSAEKENI